MKNVKIEKELLECAVKSNMLELSQQCLLISSKMIRQIHHTPCFILPRSSRVGEYFIFKADWL